MDTLRQDLRLALRQLANHPGYTSIIVLTLALGIGINTAVFSVLHAVLLRPLPYDRPEQLVQIWETNPQRVVERELTYSDIGVNALNYEEYRAQASSFSELGYLLRYADDGMILVGGGAQRTPERVWAWSVSPSVFAVLGVQPQLGRVFADDERAPPGRMRWTEVAVISHDLWQRRFHGDPGIIGRQITLDAGPATVLGVMPPGFRIPPTYERGAVLYRDADVFVPLFYQAYQQPRQFRQFKVIGRLRPDATLPRAQAELRTIASRLEAAYPESNAGWTAVATPLHTLLARDYGLVLWLFMGAVVLVLLVACANVANLSLVRGAARQGELGVRVALGGGRARLARLLLTESLVLAMLGGALALLLAAWCTDLLLAIVPEDVPRAADSGISLSVLGFTAALSLATGLVFGLLPALRASQVQPLAALRAGGGRAGTGPDRRAPQVLVAAQVAVVLVLLVGGGLLLRSFLRLHTMDAGYDATNVLIASLHFGAHDALTGFAPDYRDTEEPYARVRRQFSFTHDMLEGLAATPGVTAVASAAEPPFSGSASIWPIRVEAQFEQRQRGEEVPDAEQRRGLVYHVSPDYFRTLGIPLLRGRAFPPWDGVSDWQRYDWSGGCTEFVGECYTIVSESMARALWPGMDPIGQRVGIYDCCVTVIGVVADAHYRGVDEIRLHRRLDDGFQMYLPGTGSHFLVRTHVPPHTLTGAVRDLVAPRAPEAGVSFSTLEQRAAASLARPRFYVLMIGAFAGIALLLALVGLYGVAAHAARARTREIGLRMALGAQRRNVLWLMLRQGMAPVLAGIALGTAAALAGARVLDTLLYGMQPAGGTLVAGVAVVLAAVGAVASYLPASRASRMAPLDALRNTV